MRIAVLSDSHDNISNLERLLPRLQDAGMLIFCGDLCAPFSLETLARGFSGPVHVTLGNNDVSLAVPCGQIEVEGHKVAFVHEPLFAEGLAALGRFDAVFFGHSHQREVRKLGKTLLANPGEVMGRLGQPGCGIYDTAARAFAHIDI